MKKSEVVGLALRRSEGPVKLATAVLAVVVLLAIPAPSLAATRSDGTAVAVASHNANWCKTATVRIGRWYYWPYGTMGCKSLMRKARAFILHNRRPAGWKCDRYIGSNDQPYGSCWRGKRRYFGVTIPH